MQGCHQLITFVVSTILISFLPAVQVTPTQTMGSY